MNLLREYALRHGITAVPPVDEGVLFFSRGRQPVAICTTSTLTKNHTTCRRCCDGPAGLIAEVFVPQKCGVMPWTLVGHDHIDPDADLRGHVRKFAPRAEPVIVVCDREVEAWLWRFFTVAEADQFGGGKRPKTGRDDFGMCYEHMLAVLTTTPRLFDQFYHRLYQPVLLNRKYLLYG